MLNPLFFSFFFFIMVRLCGDEYDGIIPPHSATTMPQHQTIAIYFLYVAMYLLHA